MLKKMMTLISLILVASMILIACGNPAGNGDAETTDKVENTGDEATTEEVTTEEATTEEATTEEEATTDPEESTGPSEDDLPYTVKESLMGSEVNDPRQTCGNYSQPRNSAQS